MIPKNRVVSEVVASGTIPQDYVAFYPLTGTAEDVTTNYDGTEVGVTYVDDATRGSVASSNNGTGNINLPTINFPVNSSLSIWVKHSVALSNTRGTIIANSHSAYYSMLLYPDNVYIKDINNNYKAWGHTLNTDYTWNHLSVVRNPDNTFHFYLNGSSLTETSSTGTIGTMNITKLLEQSNGKYPYTGNISDFRVYNRALSQSEIEEIYDAELAQHTI